MKKHKQLDREQRYQIGALLEAGNIKSEIADIIGVQQIISNRISRIGKSWIKTMTFDNGKEFAGHQKNSARAWNKNIFYKTVYLTGQRNGRK